MFLIMATSLSHPFKERFFIPFHFLPVITKLFAPSHSTISLASGPGKSENDRHQLLNNTK